VSKEGGGTGRGDRSQFHCPDAQNDRAVRKRNEGRLCRSVFTDGALTIEREREGETGVVYCHFGRD